MKAQNIKNTLQFKLTVALIYVVLAVGVSVLAYYFSTASVHVSLY
jgi:hypothetical protein